MQRRTEGNGLISDLERGLGATVITPIIPRTTIVMPSPTLVRATVTPSGTPVMTKLPSAPTAIRLTPTPLPTPIPTQPVRVTTTASGTPVMMTKAPSVTTVIRPATTPIPMPTQPIQVGTTPSGTPVMVTVPPSSSIPVQPTPTRIVQVDTTPSETPVMSAKPPAWTPAPTLTRTMRYQFLGIDITDLVVSWNDLIAKIGFKKQKLSLSRNYNDDSDGTLRDLERG